MNMESLNKQQIEFLKEQITDLKREMTAGFAKLEAKLEILTDGYVKKEEFQNHCAEAKEIYVTQAEFTPIKKVVYGAVSLILTAVLGALIYLVIQK